MTWKDKESRNAYYRKYREKRKKILQMLDHEQRAIYKGNRMKHRNEACFVETGMTIKELKNQKEQELKSMDPEVLLQKVGWSSSKS